MDLLVAYRPMCDRCVIDGPGTDRQRTVLGDTEARQEVEISGGSGRKRFGATPCDLASFALLIRGFGVRVPGGAPPMSRPYSHRAMRPSPLPAPLTEVVEPGLPDACSGQETAECGVARFDVAAGRGGEDQVGGNRVRLLPRPVHWPLHALARLLYAELAGRLVDVDPAQAEQPAATIGHGPRAQKSTGSRMIGQVMQWPPPRPRPSSAPTIVMTSTPALRSNAFLCVFRSYVKTTPGSTATALFPLSHCWRSEA